MDLEFNVYLSPWGTYGRKRSRSIPFCGQLLPQKQDHSELAVLQEASIVWDDKYGDPLISNAVFEMVRLSSTGKIKRTRLEC